LEVTKQTGKYAFYKPGELLSTHKEKALADLGDSWWWWWWWFVVVVVVWLFVCCFSVFLF
jgi:hypothetical protein